jgi:predicted ester cyclase
MTFDIDGLLDLWSRPHVPGHAAQAAFGHFYTDPVVVNGASLRLADLVDRAIALQETFDDVESEVLDMVETEAAVTVVFRLSGRQSGILSTGAGPVPATGRTLTLRIMDLLRLTDGKVSAVWMTADELGALSAVDAVTIRAAAIGA